MRARAEGDAAAAWALATFTLSCRRGIASMAASLDRLDALVFTGEIGEDQPEVREEICSPTSRPRRTSGGGWPSAGRWSARP
ncbi:hypothetical protein [Streptomyces luteogriseus]|uniref:hypothetical protein n=1 Tax=Streptomyces luteogriseus TaxID=68233 RepID=UPI0038086369